MHNYADIRADGFIFRGYGKDGFGRRREVWISPATYAKKKAQDRERNKEKDRDNKIQQNREYRVRKKRGISVSKAFSEQERVRLQKEADTQRQQIQQRLDNIQIAQAQRDSFDNEQARWRRSERITNWQDQQSHYEKHRDKILIKSKQKWENNKAYLREYQRRIYSTPEQKSKRRAMNKKWKSEHMHLPKYRLKQNISARLSAIFARKGYKGKSAMIGCTWEFLKDHIQSQFKKEMSWNNYGSAWHVDHIKPLSSFNLDDVSDLPVVCNWSNLRPMFASDNISKGAKILTHSELGGNLFGWT